MEVPHGPIICAGHCEILAIRSAPCFFGAHRCVADV